MKFKFEIQPNNNADDDYSLIKICKYTGVSVGVFKLREGVKAND